MVLFFGIIKLLCLINIKRMEILINVMSPNIVTMSDLNKNTFYRCLK